MGEDRPDAVKGPQKGENKLPRRKQRGID